MSPNAGIIQQAQATIARATVVRAALAQHTTTSDAYRQLDNCIWTAENTVKALDLRATAPDDLAAALRHLSAAIPRAEHELQQYGQHP
jgi:hypothetical protein